MNPSVQLLKRLASGYLRPHLRQIIYSLLLMAVAAAMTAVLATRINPIINEIFINHNKTLLLPIALSVFVAFVMRGFATYGHTVYLNTTGQHLVSDLQKDLYRHALQQDLAFFHANPLGELLIRLTNDVTLLRIMVSDAITAMGKNIVTLIALIGVMFYQDWQLAIMAFVVFPISGYGVMVLGRSLRRMSKRMQTSWATLTSQATEVFQGIRQVKAYGMEQYESDRAAALVDHLFKLVVRGFRVTSMSSPISEILSALAVVTIILYGGNRVIEGRATAGELFSFITAFLLAYEPMKKLANVNASLQIGLASAERIFTILDTHTKILEKPNAATLDAARANISLKNVTFSYGEETALHNVTMDIPAGKKVALVGASGAGKSTILNLIPRFYDVQQGSVTINENDIRDLTLASLRNHIALVSQDIAIFDDTITSNIAYGRQNATQDEIIAAARAAYAHEFILALPQGYDTRLGEQGTRLSGGQRQRIAIARAILRNPPILLLDEATSALDTESERAIVSALAELSQGRTTLVVAHRLSTIRDADLIYVMDKGAVVESGNHDELIAARGVYAKLYGIQYAV